MRKVLLHMPKKPEDQFAPRTVVEDFPYWRETRKPPERRLESGGSPQTEFQDFMREAREKAGDTLHISHIVVSDQS